MCAIQWVLLKSCIFGLCISVTEAGVMLKTFDEKNTYSIGTAVELVCSITPYNNEMTWFVNNDPYADCTVGTCNPYSNKPYAFSFTFNETAGVFKLAIGSVTYSHADLSFACDDGIERKQISFSVTADNGTTSNTSKIPTKPDINNQITVANEGNGDNDDRTLVEGAIAGIVVGIVVVIVVPIAVIVVYLYKRKEEEKPAQQEEERQRAIQAQVAVAAQLQAELEEEEEKLAQEEEQRRREEEEKLAQEEEQRRRKQLKAIINVWIKTTEYCRIIMQEFLKIDKLFETIVIETEKVLRKEQGQLSDAVRLIEQGQLFATVRYIEQEWKLRQQGLDQRWSSLDLVGSTTDARSKMQELVKDSTFSSHIMQDKDFLIFIERELPKNAAIYEAIEKILTKKTRNNERRENERSRRKKERKKGKNLQSHVKQQNVKSQSDCSSD